MHRKHTNPYLVLMRTSRLLSLLRRDTSIPATPHSLSSPPSNFSDPFSSFQSKLQIPHYHSSSSSYSYSSYSGWDAKFGGGGGGGIRGFATYCPSKLRCLVSVHCSERKISLLGPFSFDSSNHNSLFRRSKFFLQFNFILFCYLFRPCRFVVFVFAEFV